MTCTVFLKFYSVLRLIFLSSNFISTFPRAFIYKRNQNLVLQIYIVMVFFAHKYLGRFAGPRNKMDFIFMIKTRFLMIIS